MTTSPTWRNASASADGGDGDVHHYGDRRHRRRCGVGSQKPHGGNSGKPASWRASCRRRPSRPRVPRPPARLSASLGAPGAYVGARVRPGPRRLERACAGDPARRIRPLAFVWPSPIPQGGAQPVEVPPDGDSCLSRIVLSATRAPEGTRGSRFFVRTAANNRPLGNRSTSRSYTGANSR